MQAIRTAPRNGIDQRHMQVVLAQKPGKRTHRSLPPLFAAVNASRGEARGNCGGRLDRLLVECVGLVVYFAEALGANRSEASGRRSLQRHEPTERPEAGLDIRHRIGRQSGLNQRVRQSRVVVGENVFKPEPIVVLVRDK